MFVGSYASERRYARDFSGYLKRELKNKIDMICGFGLSPTKIIRELWFLRKMRGANFLVSVSYYLGFWFMTKLTRKEIFEHSTSLSNNVLSDYVIFINYVKSLSRATRLGLIEREYADRLIQKVFAGEKTRSAVQYAHALGFEL
jgi:ribonucleotide reductase beta subunit family protein with ferritin-like domain